MFAAQLTSDLLFVQDLHTVKPAIMNEGWAPGAPLLSEENY